MNHVDWCKWCNDWSLIRDTATGGMRINHIINTETVIRLSMIKLGAGSIPASTTKAREGKL